MKAKAIILTLVLGVGCGGKKQQASSCEAVAKHLAELEAGDKASFMTDRERTTRAQRWIAKCEAMSDATRKCVLAAKAMTDADVCLASGSPPPPEAAAAGTAAWVVRGGGPRYQDAKFVALATDGDVIAAGDFAGALELGRQSVTAHATDAGPLRPGKTVERTDAWVARFSPSGEVRWVKAVGRAGNDNVTSLAIAADGSVTTVVRSETAPTASRVSLAGDGSPAMTPLATEHPTDVAALHANGEVVLAGRATGASKDRTCSTPGFLVQGFSADGKRQWSRCNDAQTDLELTDNPMRLAVGANGATAACGEFVGALAWGGEAAQAPGAERARVFVMVLEPDGQQRWVSYVAGERAVTCDALAMLSTGGVVAIVHGVGQGSALARWEKDGTQRWTRSCTELLGVPGDCELTAVTNVGSEIVVAAHSEAGTMIATLDVDTGAKQRMTVFPDGGRIDGLAASASGLAFVARFSGTIDFGTGAIESTPGEDDAPMDALIGRL